MKRSIQLSVAVIFGIAAIQSDALARGFGGFHGGGFGGAGGSLAGGFDAGGFHTGGAGGGFGGSHAGGFGGGGFDSGGSRAGGFDAGGDRAGGYGGFGGDRFGGADAGGFHASGYGGYASRTDGRGGSVNRSELSGFLGMPTDGGMRAAAGGSGGIPGQSAAAWRGGATGHVDEGPKGTTIAHGTAGIQAAAIGPGGAAAGGRIASGTAVEGPGGNVYTHTTSAGRGIAAGPQGVAGGRYIAGSSTLRGPGASPTFLHAQGLAAQNWFAARPLFTPGWCAGHPWGWCPAGYTAAAWATAAWNVATWPTVGSWLTWSATPAYYDYGDNVTYQNNNVYYGTQPVATQEQYYQQAVNIAGSDSAAQPAGDAQWLPLGVFGLMPVGQKTPEMVFQLAVNKDGVIAGNYYDQIADNTLPVHGAVDKKDQRAAWSVGKNKNLVIETGVYNLTQNQSTALVHFGADRTEQFVLVRVKQPAGQGQQQPAAAPAN